VKKLAIMVGKFTVEDELKAGFMGPNSPAMKFTGTDDCRWTVDGFAVICETLLYRPGKKYSDTSFVYYDPTSKTYRYHAVDSSGGTEAKLKRGCESRRWIADKRGSQAGSGVRLGKACLMNSTR
jgi:hypothetical protein